jgi:uncharacterized protein (TIGR03083 family)
MMTATSTRTEADTIRGLSHSEWMALAETEFARMVALLQQLRPEQWQQQTVCELWDVRAMAGHVLGMAQAQASLAQFIHDLRSAHKRSGGSMIDALNATQVKERSHLTTAQVVDGLVSASPRAVRARRRSPAPMRWLLKIPQDPPFQGERLQYGFLVDTIFTRDTWIHRLDIARATGREMALTRDHDGRILADAVADWARRHSQPFDLTLTGPAGGRWGRGTDGEAFELDALDFCWTVAGRMPGGGLLSTRVPF